MFSGCWSNVKVYRPSRWSSIKWWIPLVGRIESAISMHHPMLEGRSWVLPFQKSWDKSTMSEACQLEKMMRFWLRLLNLFYLYFMHFWAIQTRKYQTNFMISLYWCDLYCISISVTGLFFKRPEYTFDVYLPHFFLQSYRQTRFLNYPY